MSITSSVYDLFVWLIRGVEIEVNHLNIPPAHSPYPQCLLLIPQLPYSLYPKWLTPYTPTGLLTIPHGFTHYTHWLTPYTQLAYSLSPGPLAYSLYLTGLLPIPLWLTPYTPTGLLSIPHWLTPYTPTGLLPIPHFLLPILPLAYSLYPHWLTPYNPLAYSSYPTFSLPYTHLLTSHSSPPYSPCPTFSLLISYLLTPHAPPPLILPPWHHSLYPTTTIITCKWSGKPNYSKICTTRFTANVSGPFAQAQN